MSRTAGPTRPAATAAPTRPAATAAPTGGAAEGPRRPGGYGRSGVNIGMRTSGSPLCSTNVTVTGIPTVMLAVVAAGDPGSEEWALVKLDDGGVVGEVFLKSWMVGAVIDVEGVNGAAP